MGHIQGANRHEEIEFPQRLDDDIAVDNPVRFIDAFVDELDLEALGFRYVVAAATGRPSYQPGDLLKLYIYGYLYRLRPSRRLEQETQRNMALMWLLNKLPVQPVRCSAVVSTPSSLGATFAPMRPRLVAPARSRPSARAIKGAGGSHAGWTSICSNRWSSVYMPDPIS
jgi:hypothetical protein